MSRPAAEVRAHELRVARGHLQAAHDSWTRVRDVFARHTDHRVVGMMDAQIGVLAEVLVCMDAEIAVRDAELAGAGDD